MKALVAGSLLAAMLFFGLGASFWHSEDARARHDREVTQIVDAMTGDESSSTHVDRSAPIVAFVLGGVFAGGALFVYVGSRRVEFDGY